jgi:hypothetical protein
MNHPLVSGQQTVKSAIAKATMAKRSVCSDDQFTLFFSAGRPAAGPASLTFALLN